MHPRDAEGFEWNNGNREELAKHRIAEWEAEEVFVNGPVWPRNKRTVAAIASWLDILTRAAH